MVHPPVCVVCVPAAAGRSLLRGVMLRRTKASVEAQLALPPCSRVDVRVALSGVERAFYGEVLRTFK